MTQQEFTSRTLVEVSTEEFWAINEVYNHCNLDKDEFCKLWRKMNASRVAEAKAKAKAQAEQERIFSKTHTLILKLTCNGNAYHTDWYYRTPVTKMLNASDCKFLEEQGFNYKNDEYGAIVFPYDLVYDLKKSLALV